MPRHLALGLVLALAAGCGDDDSTAPDAGDAMVAEDGAVIDDGGAADATAEDGGPTVEPDASSATDGGSTGAAPRLVSVAWVHGEPCTNRDREVTITTTVEDPDTPAASLILSGSVTGCVGDIDAPTATVVCRGTSSTIGYLHVEDEGGRADDQAFNLPYCEDGSHSF